jgi:NAD(P)-dependent dehydrogenase (short-subunit alcohol dehydrogenase family)
MLAEEGALVTVADQNAKLAEETAQRVQQMGGRALWFQVDVTDQGQVDEAVQKTLSEYGAVAMLIHIPGRGERKPLKASTPEDWESAVNLNLYGPLYASKAVIDSMIREEQGSITYVVSDAGRVGEANNPVYSAAKGGVIALAKALARELGRHNIRVNCVALSAMRTPGGERYLQQIAERKGVDKNELVRNLLGNYFIRRLGEPQDAANALCFLASPRAAWITGQTLSVNGGYAMI